MKNRKLITTMIALASVFIIFFPVIINFSLMRWSTKLNYVQSSNDWLSFFATYYGAVVGGLISGGLTLAGVVMTIKSSYKGIQATLNYQENELIKETTGRKLSYYYRVKSIIYKANRLLSNRSYGWNENYQKVDDLKIINDNILRYLLPRLNKLLEYSAYVDWEFHKEIKEFVKETRRLIFKDKTPDLDKLTIIVDELTETIEKNHEERISQAFEKASK